MKLQPLLLSSLSRCSGHPSSADGVYASSSSVNNHRWSQFGGGCEDAATEELAEEDMEASGVETGGVGSCWICARGEGDERIQGVG